MKLGYERTCKNNIFVTSRRKAILSGYGAEKFFIDYTKQKDNRRKQLILAIKEAQKGDTIIIPRLEMIGLKLATIEKFLKRVEEKGIHLYFPEEGEIKNEIDLRVFIRFTRIHEEMFRNYKNGTINDEYDEDYVDYIYDENFY